MIRARVWIPGSKSISHRAAIAAGLAKGKSQLKEFLHCEDTLYTVQALSQLGVACSFKADTLEIEGRGTNLATPSSREEIFVGNSGTSLRLLLGVAALARGDIVLTGTTRMQQRPIGDLVEALRQLGVRIDYLATERFPPVVMRSTGIKGGKVRIDASVSSQFISSLLLIAPYAERDVEIKVMSKAVSSSYIDLTIETMRQFGAEVERDAYQYFSVRAGQQYKGRSYVIEGDVSSASYFWAAAAVKKGSVVTKNIYPHSTKQGDIHFLDILEEMGCEVEREKDQVIVHGSELKGVKVDMSHMPDMVPTLAAIALFAKGKTHIRNVAHLRHKESDRLRAIATEWKRLGARVDELADGLIIHGGRPLKPAPVDPHNDHRIAMSLAVVGLKVKGIKIQNPGCVSKSLPTFWKLWDKIR